jgi:hypothetical protein
VENQEFDCQVLSDDNTIPENSGTQEWVKLWNQGPEMAGATGRGESNRMAQQMRDAGFVPIGSWPKDKRLRKAGEYGLAALLDGMHRLSVKIFTNCLRWSTMELEIFLAQVRTELKRKSIQLLASVNRTNPCVRQDC